MANDDQSRRDFLRKASSVGFAAMGAGVIAACGGGKPSAESAEPDAAAATATACNDLTGLTDQEKQMRSQLQYVDVAADPTKECTLCALWVAAPEGSPCGTCQIIKGPISPKGYCMSFAPKPA